MSLWNGRHPAVLALLVQLGALLLVGLLLRGMADGLSLRGPLWAWALLQGALAAGLGHVAGLSRWWLPINALFVPGLLWVGGQDVPPGWLLGAFVGLALLNWNSLIERVPLYLSGRRVHHQLVQLARTQPADFAFVDLGCGFAGTLCQLAKAYPQARLEGFETAPLVFLIAWLRCLPRRNCRIRFRSLWTANLGEFALVYCFLSPAPMPALWRKAQAQMRAGALLVSNSFEVPGEPPEQMIELRDWRRSRLLIWRPGGGD
ncbi:MAG: class I SAM-dependent methyltransferase [Pseudomonas sp.]|uniref:class I SAM-dependent methyltransferase n=1 Tax=Pseudomonas sp. TaxID=306 RepID=UPI003391F0D6